ncbi:MAG TPA: glycosyltransferase family 4 protein [Bacteroidota bacterium]|nr:glycosyltransferase family 4 protein [Bacteroidota bacterium]
MKILVINWQDIRHPLGGGAEVHLHEIFKRLVTRGHAVTLLCSALQPLPREETIDGITIIRRGHRNTFHLTVPSFYIRRLASRNFDIVVDDVNKIPFYTPLYVRRPLAGIIHHLFGKAIMKEAGNLLGSYVYLNERMALRAYRRIPIAAVSESTKKELIESGFSNEQIAVVPNAVDHGVYRPGSGDNAGEVLIGHFGRLKKYKSVDHLLMAFRQISDRIPDAKLLIVGEGDARRGLEELSQKLGISSRVDFRGFVPEKEKVELLQQCSVVVNCSIKEGWGLTVLEANSCGVPVVASDVPGLRDSVVNGRTGLLYPYGDIDQLKNRILQVIEDKTLRNELAHHALEWARSFSWDKSADLMEKFLHAVVQTGNAYWPSRD